MYRNINKNKSIFKILLYSGILTSLAVVPINHWRYMKIWDFINFKAIALYIEDNLSVWIFVGIPIFILYKFLSWPHRVKSHISAGANSTYSDLIEAPNSVDSFLNQTRAKWDEDSRSSPVYSNYYNNVWHHMKGHKRNN